MTQVRRDDVVAAALDLLRRGGVGALSMRRLADELGTSTQVVYSRVGGKAEVVRAVHDLGFGALADGVAAMPPGVTATRDDVVAVAQSYLAFARAEPMWFEVMFATPFPDFTRDADARAVEYAAFRTCWVGPVSRWLDEHAGDRPRGAATRLAWHLWTAVHGITTVDLAGLESPSGDASQEIVAVVDLLLAQAAAPIG